MQIKYTYRFCNEEITIEIDESDYEILIELDRESYNSDRRETRRHTSIEALPFEGNWFRDDTDLEDMLIHAEEMDILHKSVQQLKPSQQHLVKTLYLSNSPISQAEYAKRLGIAEKSVQQNARRTKVKLRAIISRAKKV